MSSLAPERHVLFPRRLVLFAHAPRQEMEPEVHPGNTGLLISAGAHELAFLRARSVSRLLTGSEPLKQN